MNERGRECFHNWDYKKAGDTLYVMQQPQNVTLKPGFPMVAVNFITRVILKRLMVIGGNDRKAPPLQV